MCRGRAAVTVCEFEANQSCRIRNAFKQWSHQSERESMFVVFYVVVVVVCCLLYSGIVAVIVSVLVRLKQCPMHK